MWEDYPYYPLRKEFPLAGIETPLPAADIADVTGVEAEPAPMMGGPFVAPPQGVVSESEPRAKMKVGQRSIQNQRREAIHDPEN